MRIISTETDYYDKVQGHLTGTDLVWTRLPLEIEIDREKLRNSFFAKSKNRTVCFNNFAAPSESLSSYLRMLLGDEGAVYFSRFPKYQSERSDIIKNSVEISRVGVLFCGKLYQGLRIGVALCNTESENDLILEIKHTYPVQYLWTEEQVVKLCETYKLSLVTRRQKYLCSTYLNWKGEKVKINEGLPMQPLIDQIGCREAPDLMEWAVNTRTAILLINPSFHDYRLAVLTRDAVLSQVEFFRLFSPTQAYQELSMFHGSLASPNPPMVELQDKDKQAKFGFTHPYSFKKEPGGKKRRKNK